jgi:hypothetical protein
MIEGVVAPPPPPGFSCVTLPHLHPNGTFYWDSQGGVPKLSQFGFPGLWQLITPCSDLRLGWGLKQTCSSPWELSNGVLHSPCTHRSRVDSWLLVVGSQIVNLTPSPSFTHNLCYRCPNGSYKAIFDIYASRPFQRYKNHLKARCFDPWNWVAISGVWVSSSHSFKVGLRHRSWQVFIATFHIVEFSLV